MNNFSVWPIAESSQLGEVRRYAAGLARTIGFSENDSGKVSIIVTEAVTNLLKHSHGGELLLRPLTEALGEPPGLEIMAIDKGPGIANIDQALRDGYSTAGSPGTGLGAIVRLASSLEIYTYPKQGTVLLADLYLKPGDKPATPSAFEVGAICLPKLGETLSGDAWLAHPTPDGLQVVVVDGLGHGPLAAETAQAAIAVFAKQPGLAPGDLVQACHDAMHGTRGAALAVARISLTRGQVTYAGVGNIAGSVWSPTGQNNMVSHNGIVGLQMHKVQEFTYPWPPNALLIMHSDGLSSQFKMETYPGLAQRPPGLIAGVLYRDFRRERDDASVVVARVRRP